MARGKGDLVRYKCYACGKQMKLPAKKIDSGVKCPKCKSPITNNPPPPPEETPDAPIEAIVAEDEEVVEAAPVTPDAPDVDSDDESPAADDSSDEHDAHQDDDDDDDHDGDQDDDDDDDDDEERPRRGGGVSAKRRGGGDAGARMTARAGTASLQRLAGLAPLLGVLLLLASGAIAGYYVSQGGAAVMASNEKEAMFNAVFFGCLGVIGFIVLYTCGKLAKGLVAVANLVGDLRDELRDG